MASGKPRWLYKGRRQGHLDATDRHAICGDDRPRTYHQPVQHPPPTAKRVGECIEASGCEFLSVAHRPAITLSKAQTQKDRPCFRGPRSKDRDQSHLGKVPRDPAGDWCNGPWSNGPAPSPTDHGPHSKAKGPRPEEQGPRCKIQHSRSGPRSKRPGPMSLAHRPCPRALGSIPKVKVPSRKPQCQVSCGLGIRTPPHGPRSNLQPPNGNCCRGRQS